MRLTLHHFKCYDEYAIDLDQQGLTLIKGPSGGGKSSLLVALAWVLYGGIRNVAAHSGGQCWVKLEYRSLTIYRQKKPELLRVLDGETLYEGDAAQTLINQHFGTKEVWYGSCYLPQNTSHSLLELSNADRMQLLTSMAFGEDQPDIYLRRLEEEIAITKKALAEQENGYKRIQAQVDLLNQQFKVHQSYLNLELDLNQEQTQAKQQLLVLQGQLKQQRQQFGAQQLRRQELEQAKQELITLKYVSVEVCERDLEELQRLMTRADNESLVRQVYHQRKNLLDRQQQLKELLSEDSSIVSERDLLLAEQQHRQYMSEKTKCEKYCSYNSDKVDDLLSKLNQYQAEYKRRQKVDELSRLDFDPDGLSSEERRKQIEQLNQQLAQLKIGLTVLTCPQCHAALRVEKGQLQSSNINSVSPEEIETIKGQLRRLQTNEQNAGKYEQLAPLLQQPTQEVPSEWNLSRVEMARKELSSIKFVTPIDIERIRKDKQSTEARKELDEIENRLSQIKPVELPAEGVKVDLVKKDIAKIKLKRDNIIKTNQRIERLEEIIKTTVLDENLEAQISSCESQITQLTKRQNELEKIKRAGQLWIELQEFQRQLNQNEQGVKQQLVELQRLEQLRKIALEVECELLEGTVGDLNQSLAVILERLFVEPIDVRLSLYKNLKTSDRIKQTVNLVINYKGAEYDHVNQLSGGEGDRISLALTLAMCQLVQAPFLLLDESLSSLDENAKEAAVETIRRIIPNKAIYLVAHDIVEGIFDREISV